MIFWLRTRLPRRCRPWNRVQVIGSCFPRLGLFMYRPHRAKYIPTALWCDLSPTEWLQRKMEGNLYMQTATWLVSRELTEAAGPWDTRLLSDDDEEYFCRVLLASEGVLCVGSQGVVRGPGIAFGGLSYIGQSERRIGAHWLWIRLNIKYLRSLEDGERTRAACLRYLRTSLIRFYPEKTEIVQQAKEMAGDLGGQLESASLSWKYSWMKTHLWLASGQVCHQMLLKFRWKTAKWWDKAVSRIADAGPLETRAM